MATLVRLARLVRHVVPSMHRRRAAAIGTRHVCRAISKAERAARRLEAELGIGRQTLMSTATRLGMAL